MRHRDLGNRAGYATGPVCRICGLFRDRVQLGSGLVDLVIGVGRHGGAGHRFAHAGKRFWPDPKKWSTASESRSLLVEGCSVSGLDL